MVKETKRKRKRRMVTAAALHIIKEAGEISLHTVVGKCQRATKYELSTRQVAHYLIPARRAGIIHRRQRRFGYSIESIYCWTEETD